jgi:protein phosphatase 1D
VVSPCPDVSVLEIDVHSHRCIILGTDGLWNMLTPQDAVNSVYFAEKNNDKQPVHFLGPNDPLSKSWINPSKRLVDRALDRWMQHALRADNTSVVTVVVDPPGPPKVKVVHKMVTSGAGK